MADPRRMPDDCDPLLASIALKSGLGMALRVLEGRDGKMQWRAAEAVDRWATVLAMSAAGRDTPGFPAGVCGSAEAALVLGLSAHQVTVLARGGTLPGVQVARRWMFSRQSVEELAATRGTSMAKRNSRQVETTAGSHQLGWGHLAQSRNAAAS